MTRSVEVGIPDPSIPSVTPPGHWRTKELKLSKKLIGVSGNQTIVSNLISMPLAVRC